jgi:hypothetical protein
MHHTAVISVSGTMIAIVAVLMIVALVTAFSAKRILFAIVLLATVGLVVCVAGALFVSFSGIHRAPNHSQPYVYLGNSNSAVPDRSFDGNLIRLDDEPSEGVTVHVYTADSSSVSKAESKASSIEISTPIATAIATDETKDRSVSSCALCGEDCEVEDCKDCEDCHSETCLVSSDADPNPIDEEDVWSEDPALVLDAHEFEPVIGSKKRLPGDQRPGWAFEELQVMDEPHCVTVRIGPYTSWKEVDRHEEAGLRDGLKRYAEWYLHATGRSASARIGLDALHIPPSRLRECIGETFDHLHESPSPTVGDMPMRYVLLKFDRRFREDVIERNLERSQSIARSKRAGGFAAGVLAMIAAAFGFLKLDSATGGSRRPTMVKAAGIVGGLLVTMALYRMIR